MTEAPAQQCSSISGQGPLPTATTALFITVLRHP